MPRRESPERRETPPDIRYDNVMVAKLIRKIMQRGKLSLAEQIVYGAFDLVEQRFRRHPVQVFEQALRNATPMLEVKPRRVGGATYQVPVEVRPERRVSLGLRWLVQAARQRAGKSMAERLAAELMDAYNSSGAAVKRREDTHRMAEANKAFAHYRW